ncbi:MAG: class I SAM-dependent methyltransferase [Xanthomonadaceae bacterium]|nr:class I SAM-dependent methyltransferase [Xanthomonadaceae bacterium]
MSSGISDPALETLWAPFDSGLLPWPPSSCLFLRARAGASLRRHAAPGWKFEQSFKPLVDELIRQGFDVDPELTETAATMRYSRVLVLPPRQREEARALLARAVSLAAPAGIVVACMENGEGAKSGESDLKLLAGPGGSLSKRHCRVFWTPPLPDTVDGALLSRWLALDEPRSVRTHGEMGGEFLSRPGIFSWNRIDPASSLLARHLPANLAGQGADLGVGYGYLADAVLSRCPRIVRLDLYDAEARALALAERNLARYAPTVDLRYRWHDVTTGLQERYDFIVSNPPFHGQGREGRPEIGQRFIATAAAALRPSGRLWMVANRHLPYEKMLSGRFGEVRVVADDRGFKVIEAIGAKRS